METILVLIQFMIIMTGVFTVVVMMGVVASVIIKVGEYMDRNKKTKRR